MKKILSPGLTWIYKPKPLQFTLHRRRVYVQITMLCTGLKYVTHILRLKYQWNDTQNVLKMSSLPSRRRPLEMHSSTRRKASPGPKGCWLLLRAFSTKSSIAYKTIYSLRACFRTVKPPLSRHHWVTGKWQLHRGWSLNGGLSKISIKWAQSLAETSLYFETNTRWEQHFWSTTGRHFPSRNVFSFIIFLKYSQT